MNTSDPSSSNPPAPTFASRFLTPMNIGTMAAYVVGVLWRCLHVLKLHNPLQYVDSDMAMYVGLAKRFAIPGFTPKIGDITHPPATGMLFSWFYQRDNTFHSLINFQLFITCLVPLAVGAFALAVFDRRTAKWALIASCFYYPFIDYGGYFLAEVYMMLLNPLAAALFVAAARQKTMGRVIVVGLVAGVVFWLAMSFKMVAFLSMMGFCALYWLFYNDAARSEDEPAVEAAKEGTPKPRASRKLKTVAILALLLGAAPGTAALSVRCTAANEGHFCLVSNKAPADFLLGHYGRIQGLSWKDSKGRVTVTFGSPAAYQRGYREVPSVPFLITDGPQNSAYAWAWIRQHPVDALILSCEHVYDSFCGSLPWPSVANGFWAVSESFHFIFLLFLLLPSLMRCLDVIRRQGFRAFLQSRDLLVLSLVFGLVAAVFVATGEERYRMPYDSVFILLAVRFYMSFKLPALSPADAHLEATGEEIPSDEAEGEADAPEPEEEGTTPAAEPA
jgi:hypothetical protein